MVKASAGLATKMVNVIDCPRDAETLLQWLYSAELTATEIGAVLNADDKLAAAAGLLSKNILTIETNDGS